MWFQHRVQIWWQKSEVLVNEFGDESGDLIKLQLQILPELQI